MTFHSSRNAANEALTEAGKGFAGTSPAAQTRGTRHFELAQAHIALAQAEAFHELATQLGNVAQAIAQGRR